MSEGIETYRGTVYRWEVDNVDHFTVAYYFQRFDDATAALLDALSVDQKTSPSGAWVPGAARVRYLRELRVGDILHIRSGVLEADRHSVLVAHRLFDSASGELCTTAEMRMTLQDDAGRSLPLPVEAERAAATLGVAWERSPDGEAPQMRPGALFVDAVRDRVRPDEA